MKTKLLRTVRQRAKSCCHIDSMTTEDGPHGPVVTGVSIGYGTYESVPYRDIWVMGMGEDEFDRKVRQMYWYLYRNQYVREYGH